MAEVKAKSRLFRDTLTPERDLKKLQEISGELDKICTSIKRAGKNATALNKHMIGAHKVRIMALKLQADIAFRTLAKILPDLKAIELTDQHGNNPLADLIAVITQTKSQIESEK